MPWLNLWGRFAAGKDREGRAGNGQRGGIIPLPPIPAFATGLGHIVQKLNLLYLRLSSGVVGKKGNRTSASR